MNFDFGTFVFLLVLIFLNGVFAMSEIALVVSRKAKLTVWADEGDTRAERVMKIQSDPTRAFSTIQVGITSIGILSGIVGESALAEPITASLVRFGMQAEYAHIIGLAVVVVLVTYFSIVLGELVPKRLGQSCAETVACRVARPLSVFALLMAPFVKLLAVSTEVLLKPFGLEKAQKDDMTEEEIHALLQEGEENGVIEENESDMVKNVFGLDDRLAATVMTPRCDIEFIDLDDAKEKSIDKILSSPRSRLVVIRGDFNHVLGYCTTRAVLRQLVDKSEMDIEKCISQATFVPESISGLELLEHFKQTNAPLSLVVDEYGEVVGLVTPRDLLETIAGEFKPEANDEPDAVSRADGSWILDGTIAVPELKDELEITELPEEENATYNTLAGMLMLLLERVPKLGDVVVWKNWRFEVTSMQGLHIDKVLAKRVTAPIATAQPPKKQ